MNNVIELSKKRGKIYLADIDTFDDIEADLYIYCTTYADNVPNGSIHAEQLAPSYELFIEKSAWIDKGMYKDRFEDFRILYKRELTTRKDSIRGIIQLKDFISSGMNIVLFDDCSLGNLCHLQVLKDYLKESGFRVFSYKNRYFLSSKNSARRR